MDRRTLHLAPALIISASLATTASAQQVYTDGHGKEWRQLNTTSSNVSWNLVAEVCSTDGVTPCVGSIGARDITGWTWATRTQVRELFSYFDPRILEQPTLDGPEYLFTAVGCLGGGFLNPTYSFYTTFGAYLYAAGWMADLNENGTGAIGAIMGQYPVFDALWTIEASGDPGAVLQYTGIWLWRAIPGTECRADVDDSGTVDSQDFFVFLDAFFGGTLAADFNGDAVVDSGDFFDFLAAFFNGC